MLFAISIAAPIYTYAIYPVIMKLLPTKKYERNDNYCPFISVIIVAYNRENASPEKIGELIKLDYPSNKVEFVIGVDSNTEIVDYYSHMRDIRVLDLPYCNRTTTLNAALRAAKGDILLFLDANTVYDSQVIKKLVEPFADKRVGCTSGQLRSRPDIVSDHKYKSEGIYWRYENWVKIQESKRGCLSGVNRAIFAVRNGIINRVKPGIINDNFYIATYALQAGWDVIFKSDAVAYEKSDGDFFCQFRRHIREGAGYYQALAIFWRLLLPRHGSFVYISHRVIKWLVPLNLIIAFVTNAVLAYGNVLMALLFCCQIFCYIVLIVYYFNVIKQGKHPRSTVMQLLSVLFYFMSINLALLLGFVQLTKKYQKFAWEVEV